MLEVIKQEMTIAHRYGAKFNFSKKCLYVVGGEEVVEGLKDFEDLGIKIDRPMNIVFMKVPLHGSQVFLKDFCAQKMAEIKKCFDGIRLLRSTHVGLYLVHNCANVCKIVFLLRAAPRAMIEPLLVEFDEELRQLLEEVVGLGLGENG